MWWLTFRDFGKYSPPIEFFPVTPPDFNAKIIFSKLDVAHHWTAISASHTTNSIGLKLVKSSGAFPEY